ncbi:uncharacterized protein [Fopius arisanus]|uniref:Fndc5_0 protein n=1 Tax=Fopius arisanus TaxID=64838 RepID=A0A0C9RJ97_9HYME|nr:PREDICTED: uncharacterized protein LOC105270380 [Fopius arisanus]XP_011309569.1 PREDICTED: uncharacterized protein LOC105270380 [Fopius arisanus]XP_011309570.1 PREDICTED: uncharacterized protein LOC105270380 [Fopius arisanus]KAG8362550.1 hypothetical protein MA45_FARI000037 [Fopius arisanus]
MSSELDSAAHINSTYPNFPKTGSVVVRAEEALLVILVLLLWVAAIALFFNRWGKIRMLEPYQPKFQQQHRPSCAVVDPSPLPIRSCSKFNIHCLDHSQCQSIMARPRQNSVFVGSSMAYLAGNAPRRSKSAFDLQSLMLDEQVERYQQPSELSANEEKKQVEAADAVKPFKEYSKPSRLFQKERGMSVSQFDRTHVLARPMQRERGMSICHFDRMDVLAHHITPRERGLSICQLDRMDVLAKPFSVVKGSRSSIFTNAEKLEFLSRSQYQRGSRCSIGNFDASARLFQQRVKDKEESFGNNIVQKIHDASICASDRPTCSKTRDVILGYKATCV